MGILERAGQIDRDTVLCPHPQARASCTIVVPGAGRQRFAGCPDCKAMFEQLIEGWHARELGAKDVVTTMLGMGYTRLDGARFVLQLAADTLRVRLGWRSRADL